MSIPSSSRICLIYFHLSALKPSPKNPKIVQIPTFRTRSARTHLSSKPNITRILYKLYPNADFSANRNLTGSRYLSLKNEMVSKNLVKDALRNPAVAVKDTFLWYKEAFWKRKRNYLALLGAALSSRLLYLQFDMQLLG